MIFQKGLFDINITSRNLPYNLFCIVGIVILLLNILIAVIWPYNDPLTIRIFVFCICFLLFGMLIFRYYSTYLAILLVIIVYNSLIFWVTFHLGRSAGAILYYFPFLVGFLYLFFYNSNTTRMLVLVAIMFIYIGVTIFFTSERSGHFFLPEHILEKVYLLNLIFSITSTVILLVSLYRQFVSLHKSVLKGKELEHRKMVRDLDLEREKEGYALLLSLRDNISQTLASSRIYLQMNPEQQEFTRKADEQVKQALDRLNDITVELSPSMLIDLGLKDGLETYAGLLSEKYSIPVKIELDTGSADIPEVERLSLYRILQQCISIFAATHSIRFLNIHVKKGRKISLRFEHDSSLNDFSSRITNTRYRDLITRLDYYSALITEGKGFVEIHLDVTT